MKTFPRLKFVLLDASSAKVASFCGNFVVNLGEIRSTLSSIELLMASRLHANLGRLGSDSPEHSEKPTNWRTTKKKMIITRAEFMIDSFTRTITSRLKRVFLCRA